MCLYSDITVFFLRWYAQSVYIAQSVNTDSLAGQFESIINANKMQMERYFGSNWCKAVLYILKNY